MYQSLSSHKGIPPDQQWRALSTTQCIDLQKERTTHSHSSKSTSLDFFSKKNFEFFSKRFIIQLRKNFSELRDLLSGPLIVTPRGDALVLMRILTSMPPGKT